MNGKEIIKAIEDGWPEVQKEIREGYKNAFRKMRADEREQYRHNDYYSAIIKEVEREERQK